MNKFFRKVEQQIKDSGWRDTIYERLDGSRFHVAIPATDLINHGELQSRTYNEHTEMEAALRMYGISQVLPKAPESTEDA